MALLEIVIGAAIITVGILAVTTAYATYVQYAYANEHNTEAAYLLEEGQETAQFWRDSGWTANIATLSTTTTYYLSWTAGTWKATTTPQYVDGIFLRSMSVADVTRDGSDDIASSGTYDANTKNVTVSVSYLAGHATTTQSISAYLTNLYAN
jgi:Tfp pilus assembly protein PilV